MSDEATPPADKNPGADQELARIRHEVSQGDIYFYGQSQRVHDIKLLLRLLDTRARAEATPPAASDRLTCHRCGRTAETLALLLTACNDRAATNCPRFADDAAARAEGERAAGKGEP